MSTPSRERAARKLLQQPRHPPIGSSAAKRLMYEKQREDGWNNHFIEPLPRLPPLEKLPHSPLKKQSRQNNERIKPKRPHAPRATPPNVRLKPLTPNEPKPNEADVLRLKAITAIEYRENLIKQLHKLLHGIPVLSPSHQRGPKKQSINGSQKEEICSILQEMTQELQMAGIRAVESIVAWMLVTGKTAPTPPVFIWHDTNYFVHMHSDLDFLGQALSTRGLAIVMGDKSTKGNPLLIEANQKLGRVWAAQSIIVEMVEMSQIEAKSDEDNALALMDSADMSAEQENSTTEERRSDKDEEFAMQNDSNNNKGFTLDESTKGVENVPAAETIRHTEEENTTKALSNANDEFCDEPAYEDEIFEAHDHAIAVVDATTIPLRDPLSEQAESIVHDQSHSTSWELSWMEYGIAASTIDAARDLCSGFSDDVKLFLRGAIEQLDSIPQALTLLPTPQRLILSSSIVQLIDDSLYQVASNLEANLPNDPEAVDEALELFASSIETLWNPTQNERDAFSFLEVVPSFAIPSRELSRLLLLIYPYINAAPKEQISKLCRQSIDAVNAITIISKQPYLLDALAKAILFLAISTPDTSELSNVKFVCNRQRILSSSMNAMKERQWCSLFPFFASPTGEKVVQNQAVEAGEGRGPLKEWFELISQSWTKSYVAMPLPDHESCEITLSNRSLQAPQHYFTSFHVGAGSRLRLQDREYVVMLVKDLGNGLYMANIDPPWIEEPTIVHNHEVEWLEPQTPLFIYIKASESFWVNEQVIQSDRHCEILEFVGWTLAMALLHQTSLSIQLHDLLFEALLSNHFQFDLASIRALDPQLHTSLLAMHSLPDFDQVLELEELPSTTTVDEYIKHVVREKQAAIAWQIDAIRRGFHGVIPKEFTLCQFAGAQLKELICGATTSGDFDVRRVFKVVYDDAFAEASTMQSAFWSVVDIMSSSEKRALIKFITGIDKLPLPQTEFLRLDIPLPARSDEEKQLVLHRLPQAHTCENTLELPDYYSGLCYSGKDDEEVKKALVEVLNFKLRYAVAHGSGFHLDVASDRGISHAFISTPQPNASSDSIDIPTIDDQLTELVPDVQHTHEEVPLIGDCDAKDDDYSFDDFE